MRDDKSAAAVTEEPVVDVENGEPVEAETGSTRVQPGRRRNVTLSGQKISNAERVIDPVTGLKKIDLVRYYDEIAEWAFSARARSGMGVSMPVAWEELPEIRAADQWKIHSAVRRQRLLGGDPSQGYWRCRQGLTNAMRRAIGMK